MSEAKDPNQIIDLITSPEKPAAAAAAPESEKVIIATENDLLGGESNPVPPVPSVPPGQDQDPAAPPVPGEGEPVKRKRGRPPGSGNKAKPDFSDIPPAAATETLVDYKTMSCALFDMSTGILTNAFGPEWQPRPPAEIGGADERGAVCSALEVYLRSKQAKDIPPGLMLTIVVCAYAAPRLQAPTTKEKIMPAISWAWLKIKTFFGRRKTAEIHIIPATKSN